MSRSDLLCDWRPSPVRAWSRRALDRRTLLRGLGATGAIRIGLPLLDGMLNTHGTALAAGGTLPTCFGTWFWGGGPGGESEWVPSAPGPNYPLPPALLGLAKVKSYVTLVSGVNFAIENGFPHADGQPVSLSGTFDRAANGKSRGGGPTGPSLDQLVARHWQDNGKRAAGGIGSIAVGVHTEGPYSSGTSFTGPGAFVPSETDPAKVFQRLFGGGLPPAPPASSGSAPVARANLVAAHTSVLDAVLADAAALSAGLGANDRRRLQAHLDAIREIEKQLAVQPAPPPQGTRMCTAPARPASAGDADERHRVMARLLAMALACDATRVFSVEWSGAQSMAVYPSVKVEAHHPITHTDQAATKRIGRYVMDRFAELVETFMATQEGPANLLDRTVIWHTAELMNPLQHKPARLPTHPILLVGRGGGLKAGVHARRSGNEKATMAMLTVLKALGLPTTSIGSQARAGDTLTSQTMPELLA
jgi:hypothetical protein